MKLTKQEMIKIKEELFYDNFSIKTTNVEALKEFCRVLTEVTGIQCCTSFGYTNELLPKIYNSVLNTLE